MSDSLSVSSCNTSLIDPSLNQEEESQNHKSETVSIYINDIKENLEEEKTRVPSKSFFSRIGKCCSNVYNYCANNKTKITAVLCVVALLATAGLAITFAIAAQQRASCDSAEKDAPTNRASCNLAEPGTEASNIAEFNRLIDIVATKNETAADSNYILGLMYKYGQNTEQNDIEAIKLIKTAAQNNCTEAVDWIIQGADKGYPEAQFAFAEMLQTDEFVEKNNHLAFNYIVKSAKQGYAEAVDWLKDAANEEDNSSKAQFELGNMYWDGCGVKQNEVQAIEYYKKAAEQNNVEAFEILKTKKVFEPVYSEEQISGSLNIFSSNYKHFEINPLVTITANNVNSTKINLPNNEGYSLNDITVSSNDGSFKVINRSPRCFTKIAVTDGINSYVLTHELEPFSIVTFESEDIDSNEKLSFLDSNTQFRDHPSKFDKAITESKTADKEVLIYKILANKVKQFYSLVQTENNFFNYFTTETKAKPDNILSKWHTTITYNEGKKYSGKQCRYLGCSTEEWLSLDSSIDNYLVNNITRDNVLYSTFSHEIAHTQGYQDGDSLTYGWDKHVGTGIKPLYPSSLIEEEKFSKENPDLYMFYNKESKSLKMYADSNVDIDKVTILGQNNVYNKASILDGRIVIPFNKDLDKPVVFTAYYTASPSEDLKKTTLIVDQLNN